MSLCDWSSGVCSSDLDFVEDSQHSLPVLPPASSLYKILIYSVDQDCSLLGPGGDPVIPEEIRPLSIPNPAQKRKHVI